MLSELIHKSEVATFCSFVKYHKLNQRAKVCGVDLATNYLNFKLYIELLEVPSSNVIGEFLDPALALEFLKWCTFWDKSRCSSLAFGIKIDTNGCFKKYFHVKFSPNFNDVLFPSKFFFLKALRVDLNAALKGISYEIQSDGTFYQKFYVYIKDPREIKRVLAYKNMLYNLDVEEIDELELYATSKSFKVNVINKMDNYKVKQDVWQTIPAHLTSLLQECVEVLDCPPVYTGATSMGIVSVYFSFTTKNNNVLKL